MIQTSNAMTDQDYRHARSLIRQYETWLDIDLSFQGIDAELAGLEQVYGPPSGCMILALDGDDVVGCVGLRALGDGYCEMKRMFVLPGHQGKGIGSLLLTRFMEMADALGYRYVRLDTIPRLQEALRLYRRAGFKEIAAYYHNPDPDAVYMQLAVAEWMAIRNNEHIGE
jgi:ribosomal protein S18 acetylase RimI-like enzyme